MDIFTSRRKGGIKNLLKKPVKQKIIEKLAKQEVSIIHKMELNYKIIEELERELRKLEKNGT